MLVRHSKKKLQHRFTLFDSFFWPQLVFRMFGFWLFPVCHSFLSALVWMKEGWRRRCNPRVECVRVVHFVLHTHGHSEFRPRIRMCIAGLIRVTSVDRSLAGRFTLTDKRFYSSALFLIFLVLGGIREQTVSLLSIDSHTYEIHFQPIMS